MTQTFKVPTSVLGSSVRAWRGTLILRPVARQPAKTVELHEFEADPDCRLLREALTEMDLDAMIRPCPQGGQRFRGPLQAAGQHRLPCLTDPNTGRTVSGSAAIAAYLASTYGADEAAAAGPGQGQPAGPLARLRHGLDLASGHLASAARGGRGRTARPSRAPAQPLELYSFESSPYSRLVREVLCELELPYLLRNTGKGRWSDLGPPIVRDRLLRAERATSRNRRRLHERTGRVQVPYLIDPNTGAAMFESADIVAYLEHHYAR